MKYIILMDIQRNEIGRLYVSDEGAIEISASYAYKYFEKDLYSLGETISCAKITMKKIVYENETVIESCESVERLQKNYIGAVADYINSHPKLVNPRVFAVVKEEE